MKKTIVIVMIIYLVQGFIHNLGHPITPDFVTELGYPNYFGVFFALMSLGLALGGPIWGILGDKYNKKVLIFIGLIIYSIGQYVFGNVHDLLVMSIFRFISGFGVSASVTLLMSYLIEKSDSEHKVRNIAYGAALMTLGASIGYYAGGFLPDLLGFFTDMLSAATSQAEVIFIIQAILNTMYAFVVLIVLENCVESEKTSSKFIESIKSIKELNVNLLIFLISLTLISIAAINISKYIEVYIASLGYGAKGIGTFVFVTGIVSILTSIFIVPRVARLRKDIVVMLVVNVLSAIIILAVFRINEVMIALYTLFMLYVVLKAVYTPLETSYISSHTTKGEYGKIMGIRQFFFAIGFVIGPLVGGWLNNINPIYVFDLSAILFVVGFLLILIVRRNINKEIVIENIS
jgi:DHA1 family multidrug resistance protein-like MFS transporter